MQRHYALRTALFSVLVLLVSCSGVHQLVGTLQDLQRVQAELTKTLGYNEVRVNLNNGHFLNIAVVNSPWKDLPAGQKNAKAIEIARLAYASYPSRSALQAVSVTFAIHRTYLGFFNYDDTRDSFGFEVPQLTAESLTSSPTVAVN